MGEFEKPNNEEAIRQIASQGPMITILAETLSLENPARVQNVAMKGGKIVPGISRWVDEAVEESKSNGESQSKEA